MLSFTNKVKEVSVKIPEKVKLYINAILEKEIKYFQDKFKIKINFFADPELIIPEYSISLLDKNKKIVNKVESINKIEGLGDETKIKEKEKTKQKKKNKKLLPEKIKKKKDLKTLWVRRKKKTA